MSFENTTECANRALSAKYIYAQFMLFEGMAMLCSGCKYFVSTQIKNREDLEEASHLSNLTRAVDTSLF